ncbi:hypothetical protein [Synechococcus sp. RS9916]|uniref:hypothetical protein n=1 Tax=Synechococcus sp. RS9916 TaxID=221359 RepID=UPI0000E53648|nr:hypothetical protein [Synechococcus sp. RS9916]EAU74010.1 hypothetical protein RS9916_30922 [Synechococcus sp. RS9916]
MSLFSNFNAKILLSVGALVSGAIVLSPVQAQAGSVTSESIWDENNALQRAQSQVPTGHRITSERCTEIEVRESSRYRCTVTYE